MAFQWFFILFGRYFSDLPVKIIDDLVALNSCQVNTGLFWWCREFPLVSLDKVGKTKAWAFGLNNGHKIFLWNCWSELHTLEKSITITRIGNFPLMVGCLCAVTVSSLVRGCYCRFWSRNHFFGLDVGQFAFSLVLLSWVSVRIYPEKIVNL